MAKKSTPKKATAKPVKKKTAVKKAAKKVTAKKVAVKKSTKKSNATLEASQALCQLIVEGMQERKAHDIVVMDLRKVKNAIASFFVIASGTSDKQVEAIAQSVEETVYKKSGEMAWHMEGKAHKEWMLIDFVDVVAHVFKQEVRHYYEIEKLWADANITTY